MAEVAADPGGALSTAFSTQVKAGVIGVLEEIWSAGLRMVRDTLALIDALTRFDLVEIFTAERGIGQAWPALWWLAVLVATCVLFAQIMVVVAQGGWGASRLLLGPIHFGIALVFILSLSAGVVAAADGIARGLLDLALGSPDFARVLDPPPPQPETAGAALPAQAPVTGIGAVFTADPTLGEGLSEMAQAVIMAVAGTVAMVASWGLAAEMVVRQAIIVVLIAVSPIAAAGLLSGSTAAWWWRTLRWFAAAVLLEPALALVLVIGVGMLAGASGIGGLLTGTAVLLAAIFCPWAVYKLLAFVDPATGAGMDVRAITARRPAGAGSGASRAAAPAVQEAHAARFDTQARTHEQPAPHRAGGITRAARTMGDALSAGYHQVAAAGEYAGGRINQQAAQTGVGHPGGIQLNRVPGSRPDRLRPPQPIDPGSDDQPTTTAPPQSPAPPGSRPGVVRDPADPGSGPDRGPTTPAPPVPAAEPGRRPPKPPPRPDRDHRGGR